MSASPTQPIGFNMLEARIEELAKEAGLDVGGRIPFVVEGRVRELEWHVLGGTPPQGGDGATYDGILLVGTVSGITVSANLTRDQAGGGIEVGFGGGATASLITVTNNTVSGNGFGNDDVPMRDIAAIYGSLPEPDPPADLGAKLVEQLARS